MSVRGRRIHIAGSAAIDADRDLLAAAHELVGEVTRRLINDGAGMVVGTGDELLGAHGLPCTFDWTALEAVSGAPDPAPDWPERQSGRFRVVASQRGLEKIPNDRRELWERCQRRSDFELETIPAGWRMGGAIRAKQALRGDILVAIGGGAGVEQLAELYRAEGKPVIPIRSDIGAISEDGNGGSSYLHGRALSDIGAFFELREGAGGAAARLSSVRLDGKSDTESVVTQLVALLNDLRPPRAFYVRLLDTKSEAFDAVERFFREVVDAVVIEKSFTPHEVGRDDPLAAFINVEIFEGIHRAGLVVADLTGVRPNCTMELGYALARRRRVVISAMRGTQLPFDEDKLPTYFWENSGVPEDRIRDYRAWVDRYIDLPPVVE